MSSPECGEGAFRSFDPFMTSDEISPELLAQLKHLRTCYHARSPADLRRLEWPRAIDISSNVVQEWLTTHLLRDEAAFAAVLRQRLTLESAADEPLQVSNDDLGAISWRRAFMKRLIQLVEAGIFERDDADVSARRVRIPLCRLTCDDVKQCEVHEELLMEVTRLMIAVSRSVSSSLSRGLAYFICAGSPGCPRDDFTTLCTTSNTARSPLRQMQQSQAVRVLRPDYQQSYIKDRHHWLADMAGVHTAGKSSTRAHRPRCGKICARTWFRHGSALQCRGSDAKGVLK